jgi:hypothetical protein
VRPDGEHPLQVIFGRLLVAAAKQQLISRLDVLADRHQVILRIDAQNVAHQVIARVRAAYRQADKDKACRARRSRASTSPISSFITSSAGR